MASLGKMQTGVARRGDRRALDADELVSAALARAGRADYSNRSFVDPLRRLVNSYNTEADLSTFGVLSARFDIMRCLKNFLNFDSIEERHPDLSSRPIERPIFITGMPRSGTTFLHSLLAQDPDVAVPLSWQLVYPYPSKGLLGADFRKLSFDMQLRIMKWLSPELAELHPLSAGTPQECTDITAQVFQSLRFDSTYRIPSYQKWLEGHGHYDAFRFHRRFLQHLDAQAPGRRWVLKCPDHVFALDAIKAVYPDARIVFLHRDPLSVLASVAKLTEVLRRPFARHVDRIEIGRQVCASWVDGAERMTAAARASSDIVHLHYKQIVSQPMETVELLYGRCGQNFGAAATQSMRAWLDRARQSGNAQHRYSLTEFGLDQEALRVRFAPYMRAFNVEPEWEPSRRVRAFAPA